MPRFPRATAPAAVLACAALPAPLLHQALAATAGTLFEAAPFVLAVALVRAPAMRWTAAFLGCGCGSGAGFAALSLPATALCWTVFGPWPALARFGAAVVLQVAGSRGRFSAQRCNIPGEREHRLTVAHDRDATQPHCHEPKPPDPDPLEQLCSVGLGAWILALAMSAAGHMPWFASIGARGGAIVTLGELLAGAALGSIAPCSTAAVAMAAMLRASSPLATFGMLATAGLVPRFPRSSAPQGTRRDARASIALLGIACVVLALHDGAGFVHPRLVPLLWLTVPATIAALFARPTTRTRFGALSPIVMLVALVFGSPVPPTQTGSGAIDDVYPGEPIAFTGTSLETNGTQTLVRYAITCCRADATAIEVPTDLRATIPAGAWIAAIGTIARDAAGGNYLRVTQWRRVAAPADPFVYR